MAASFMARFFAKLALSLSPLAPALAQAPEQELFKGKTITIVTSKGPGGGNMLATKYVYEIAPKDGTSIAVVNNAVPLNQVLDGRGVRFDSSRFNWIGSTGGRNEAVFAHFRRGDRQHCHQRGARLARNCRQGARGAWLRGAVMTNARYARFAGRLTPHEATASPNQS